MRPRMMHVNTCAHAVRGGVHPHESVCVCGCVCVCVCQKTQQRTSPYRCIVYKSLSMHMSCLMLRLQHVFCRGVVRPPNTIFISTPEPVLPPPVGPTVPVLAQNLAGKPPVHLVWHPASKYTCPHRTRKDKFKRHITTTGGGPVGQE
jgi:hypothetical protein